MGQVSKSQEMKDAAMGKALLRLHRAKENLKSVEERIFARANDKDRDHALKELKNAESLCRKYGLL